MWNRVKAVDGNTLGQSGLVIALVAVVVCIGVATWWPFGGSNHKVPTATAAVLQASPTPGSAVQTASLQAQVSDLIGQVTVLQAQINRLQAAPTPAPKPLISIADVAHIEAHEAVQEVENLKGTGQSIAWAQMRAAQTLLASGQTEAARAVAIEAMATLVGVTGQLANFGCHGPSSAEVSGLMVPQEVRVFFTAGSPYEITKTTPGEQAWDSDTLTVANNNPIPDC